MSDVSHYNLFQFRMVRLSGIRTVTDRAQIDVGNRPRRVVIRAPHPYLRINL
jgi:hypothetical protein